MINPDISGLYLVQLWIVWFIITTTQPLPTKLCTTIPATIQSNTELHTATETAQARQQ
jgi:hypothetical protein